MGKQSERQVHIAGYQLLEKVGHGGMGMVYKARQLSMDRLVALKILPPSLAEQAGYIEKFYREARAAAKLNHLNIVAGYDVGESGGLYYFAMEFVEGETAHRRLKREGPFREDEVLQIAAQMADALGHAHRLGLIHRDIKPDNIMLDGSGVAKLLDLGLAKKVTDEMMQREEKGQAVGTPNYLSPEQATGKPDIDLRADLYCLGATLYHLLTGSTLFHGNSREVMQAHLQEQAPNPLKIKASFDPGLCFVLEKLCGKNREERYQTPGELATDLALLATGKKPGAATAPLGRSSISSTAAALAELGLDYGAGRSHAAGRRRTRPEAPVQGYPRRMVPLGGGLLLALAAGLFLWLAGGEKGDETRTGPIVTPTGPAAIIRSPPEKKAKSTKTVSEATRPAEVPPHPQLAAAQEFFRQEAERDPERLEEAHERFLALAADESLPASVREQARQWDQERVEKAIGERNQQKLEQLRQELRRLTEKGLFRQALALASRFPQKYQRDLVSQSNLRREQENLRRVETERWLAVFREGSRLVSEGKLEAARALYAEFQARATPEIAANCQEEATKLEQQLTAERQKAWQEEFTAKLEEARALLEKGEYLPATRKLEAIGKDERFAPWRAAAKELEEKASPALEAYEHARQRAALLPEGTTVTLTAGGQPITGTVASASTQEIVLRQGDNFYRLPLAELNGQDLATLALAGEAHPEHTSRLRLGAAMWLVKAENWPQAWQVLADIPPEDPVGKGESYARLVEAVKRHLARQRENEAEFKVPALLFLGQAYPERYEKKFLAAEAEWEATAAFRKDYPRLCLMLYEARGAALRRELSPAKFNLHLGRLAAETQKAAVQHAKRRVEEGDLAGAAEAYLKAGDFYPALNVLRRGIREKKFYSGDGRILGLLARLYLLGQDWRNAASAAQALADDKRQPQHLQDHGRTILEWCKRQNYHRQRAAALEKQQKHRLLPPEELWELGELYRGPLQQYYRAAAVWELVFAAYPEHNHEAALAEVASSYYKLGRWSELRHAAAALSGLNRGHGLVQNGTTTFWAAEAAFGSGKLQEARDGYLRLKKEHPEHWAAAKDGHADRRLAQLEEKKR